MKSLLLALMLLATVSAFAFHPGDNQRLNDIGTGTKLNLLTDVNISPNMDYASLGGKCFMKLKKKVDFDRVLKKGTQFTITKIDQESIDNGVAFVDVDGIRVNNQNIDFIFCGGISLREKKATIGDFKENTRGILEIVLADPQEI